MKKHQSAKPDLPVSQILFEKKATIFIPLSQLLIRQNLFINEKIGGSKVCQSIRKRFGMGLGPRQSRVIRFLNLAFSRNKYISIDICQTDPRENFHSASKLFSANLENWSLT